jgi:AraC-like DNA-binding protein
VEEEEKKMFAAADYMKQHYQENLTTKQMAEQCGYTREYFCRLFKRYVHQTFKKYLTGLRLSATVQEMQKSDSSARQIAICHGFPDEKSFINAFKKEYGTTPAKWRAGVSSDCRSQNGNGHKMEEKTQKLCDNRLLKKVKLN